MTAFFAGAYLVISVPFSEYPTNCLDEPRILQLCKMVLNVLERGIECLADGRGNQRLFVQRDSMSRVVEADSASNALSAISSSNPTTLGSSGEVWVSACSGSKLILYGYLIIAFKIWMLNTVY